MLRAHLGEAQSHSRAANQAPLGGPILEIRPVTQGRRERLSLHHGTLGKPQGPPFSSQHPTVSWVLGVARHGSKEGKRLDF